MALRGVVGKRRTYKTVVGIGAQEEGSRLKGRRITPNFHREKSLAAAKEFEAEEIGEHSCGHSRQSHSQTKMT